MRLTYLLATAVSVVSAFAASTSPYYSTDFEKREVYANACAEVTVYTPTTIAALCTIDPGNALCGSVVALAQQTLNGVLGLNNGILLKYVRSRYLIAQYRGAWQGSDADYQVLLVSHRRRIGHQPGRSRHPRSSLACRYQCSGSTSKHSRRAVARPHDRAVLCPWSGQLPTFSSD